MERTRGFTNKLAEMIPTLGKSPERGDDYRHFGGMTGEELAKVLAECPWLAEQTQNESPTVAEFLEIGRAHPHLTFYGYVIGPRREDERISVEGFEGEDTPGICADFDLRPDEMSRTRAWWD